MVNHIDLNDTVRRIKAHALANYNTGGWDYLVECYSDGDILLLIAECTSYENAVAKVSRIMEIKDSHRAEMSAMGEW